MYNIPYAMDPNTGSFHVNGLLPNGELPDEMMDHPSTSEMEHYYKISSIPFVPVYVSESEYESDSDPYSSWDDDYDSDLDGVYPSDSDSFSDSENESYESESEFEGESETDVYPDMIRSIEELEVDLANAKLSSKITEIRRQFDANKKAEQLKMQRLSTMSDKIASKEEILMQQLEKIQEWKKTVSEKHQKQSAKVQDLLTQESEAVAEAQYHAMEELKQQRSKEVQFGLAIGNLLRLYQYDSLDSLIASEIQKVGVYIPSAVVDTIITSGKEALMIEFMNQASGHDLTPKTQDGLPNLYDGYVTDSYNVV